MSNAKPLGRYSFILTGVGVMLETPCDGIMNLRKFSAIEQETLEDLGEREVVGVGLSRTDQMTSV